MQGFFDAKLVEWLTFLAEVAVAVVIYIEVEHNRQAEFFQRAVESSGNEERGKIYETFIRKSGNGSLGERRDRFLQLLRGDEALRAACDAQVRALNVLGFSAIRPFAQTQTFIELFPHGPILLWAVAGAYVQDRRRDTGTWYAQYMIVFTVKCIKLVLNSRDGRTGRDASLFMRSFDGKECLEITTSDMAEMRRELESLMAARGSYRWRKIRQFFAQNQAGSGS